MERKKKHQIGIIINTKGNELLSLYPRLRVKTRVSMMGIKVGGGGRGTRGTREKPGQEEGNKKRRARRRTGERGE